MQQRKRGRILKGNPSFRTKIFMGVISIFILYFLILVYCIIIMTRTGEEIRIINNFYIPLIKTLDTLEDHQINIEGLKKVYKTREKKNLKYLLLLSKKLFETNLQRSKEILNEWDRSTIGNPILRKNLDVVRTNLTKIEDGHKEYYQEYLKELERGDESIEKLIPILNKKFDKITKEVKGVSRTLDNRMNEISLRTRETLKKSTLIALTFSTFSLIFGVLMMVLTYFTLKPIEGLIEGVKRIGSGDLTHRVKLKSRDEIGILAEEFNRMASSLLEREEKLVRAERLASIGRIASQLTHEIRNPLNSISLNVDILEEELRPSGVEGGVKGGNEVAELLDSIKREIKRLEDITETYLELGRPPSLRLEMEDMGEVIKSTIQFMRKEIENRGVEVKLDIEEGDNSIVIDEEKIRQALINIIKNSLEAMERGGVLTLSMKRNHSGFRIDISDTGKGIPHENLKLIFDPFFTTKKRGTGLGLAVTQKIIEEHKGRIEVHSEMNRGTVFSIFLFDSKEQDYSIS